MNLVSLSEVKTELGISGSTDDAILTTLIARVSLSIQQYIGHDLGSSTRVEYYDGGDDEFFTLFPTSNTATLAVEDRVSNETYIVNLVDRRHVMLTGTTSEGNKNVKISYPFGYASEAAVPVDIKGVATRWINKQYKDYKSGDVTTQIVKSEKIQDISITYLTPDEILSAKIGGPSDFEILDTYKINAFI